MKNIENYQNIYWATERVRRKLELDPADKERDSEIQELLMISAATAVGQASNDTTEFYRPYMVAAILLSQDISANRLKSAGDVDFNSLNGIVLSLLAYQRSIDDRQGWVVPAGFSVQEFIAMNGGVGASMGTPRKPMRYGGSIPFKPVF